MAEETTTQPQPTYSMHDEAGRTIFTCLIPDAGREEGYCGHKTSDEGFMTQHMQQRHNGEMRRFSGPPPGVTPQSAPTPTPEQGTSQRTAEAQEHPPGMPAEQVQPLAEQEEPA